MWLMCCVLRQIVRLQDEISEEIERLKTERRQLEFHVERTDLWAANVGKWKAHIYNCDVSRAPRVDVSMNLFSFQVQVDVVIRQSPMLTSSHCTVNELQLMMYNA